MSEKKPYRPDLDPGFWPEYVEPSPLARAIQYPLHDKHWQNRVLAGYRTMHQDLERELEKSK